MQRLISISLPIDPTDSTTVAPTVSMEPEATAGSGNGSHISETPPYSSPFRNTKRSNNYINMESSH